MKRRRIIERLIAACGMIGAMGIGSSKQANATGIIPIALTGGAIYDTVGYVRKQEKVKKLAKMVTKGTDFPEMEKLVSSDPFLQDVVRKAVISPPQSDWSMQTEVKEELQRLPGNIKKCVNELNNTKLGEIPGMMMGKVKGTIMKNANDHKENDSKDVLNILRVAVKNPLVRLLYANQINKIGDEMAKSEATKDAMKLGGIGISAGLLKKTAELIL